MYILHIAFSDCEEIINRRKILVRRTHFVEHAAPQGYLRLWYFF